MLLNDNGTSLIHTINSLNSELQALYHQASVKHGLSDTVSIILYTIHDAGGDSCMLSDIYKNSGISKQTVNSAVRGLEANDILYLEAVDGRTKKVVLTAKGKELAGRTSVRIFEAETRVLNAWSEEEIETYIRLMEKFKEGFRQQLESI